MFLLLVIKVPANIPQSAKHTTKAEFANTVDPDETADNEPSHLDPQCLPSSPLIFNMIQFELKVFVKFADVILSSAFLAPNEIFVLSFIKPVSLLRSSQIT